MASQENRIIELFELWNTGRSSLEEDAMLRQLLQSTIEADKLTPLLESIWNELQPDSLFSVNETDAMVNKIFVQSPVEPEFAENTSTVHPLRLNSWLKYAAAVIFLIGLSMVYIRTGRKVKIIEPVVANTNLSKGTIVPGINKAILKLADGTTVDLEDANTGIVGEDSSTRIIKLKAGQLSYQLQDNQAQNTGENTISTPRGGFYMVQLSDGTKVWLNSSSSISYPVAFKGKERKVTLTGEAYFEVAKNALMPFKVEVNNMEVTVMGTHFNVKAYNEESIKTTLLEGSIKVSSGSLSTMLRPGQKAEWQGNQTPFVVQNADMEEAVAWKNGYFIFNSVPLSSIMLQLSRWYDFDYKISEDIGSNKFSGTISRTTNISKVFEMLALTKEATFNIEGKVVFVNK
jgi:transmembrane sensor